MLIALRNKKFALVAAVLAAAVLAPSHAPLAVVPADARVADYFHEARLRKLHLVRPDLISYPVVFDVVC